MTVQDGVHQTACTIFARSALIHIATVRRRPPTGPATVRSFNRLTDCPPTTKSSTPPLPDPHTLIRARVNFSLVWPATAPIIQHSSCNLEFLMQGSARTQRFTVTMGDAEVCSCPAAISASLSDHGCAIKHSSIPSRKDGGCQGHELGVELRWGRGCAAGDRTVVATRPFAKGAVVWREDPYEYVWALACAFARSSPFARRSCLSPTPLASFRHASFVQHLVRGSEPRNIYIFVISTTMHHLHPQQQNGFACATSSHPNTSIYLQWPASFSPVLASSGQRLVAFGWPWGISGQHWNSFSLALVRQTCSHTFSLHGSSFTNNLVCL
jgi:hypothetical protein